MAHEVDEVYNTPDVGATDVIEHVIVASRWHAIEVANEDDGQVLSVRRQRGEAPSDPAHRGAECHLVRPGERLRIDVPFADQSSGPTAQIHVKVRGAVGVRYSVTGVR